MSILMEKHAPVTDIRAAFPALTRMHNGLPVAYFDGPGGTQVPQVVLDAVSNYLARHNANTHWEYPSSAETDAIIQDAREASAALLNCAADEVVFGSNMTTLTFHIARALGWRWGEGDEIVVTDLDHHANIAPWTVLRQERGVTVHQVPFDTATGQLRMEEFARRVTPNTRLIAIGAASNALGTINDLDEIIMLARDVDALVYVDAVHSAAHQLPDVAALDCDFLACSAYKFYGPHIGLMYARKEIAAELQVPRLEPAPSDAPERLETGTQNHEGIAGAAAAIDFLASLGEGQGRRARLESAYARLHSEGLRLFRRMHSGLAGIGGVTLYGPGPDEPRTPTIAFTVAGRSSTEVARELASRAVFVSHGDFYAATVTERLGLGAEGLVRAGAACYTDESEVDRLVEAVRAL